MPSAQRASHAGRELLVKQESPGCMEWELFPLPCPCCWLLQSSHGDQNPAAWAKHWLVHQEMPSSSLQSAIWCLRQGSCGTRLAVGDISWDQPSRSLRPPRTALVLGFYCNEDEEDFYSPSSPFHQTWWSGDSVRAVASGWWTAANCSIPFKSKLPVFSCHKQCCFGNTEGGEEACECF